MKVRLASDLQSDSIVDGKGIRTVIWFQGCAHNCEGCHNPETHDMNGGFEVNVSDILTSIDKLEGQDGLTLSGGDPVFQVEAATEIAAYAKTKGLSVWCYTGFKYEEMLKIPKQRKFLKSVDVLVDGKFILAERSLDLYFKGSRNQRIIDVLGSLEKNQVCLVEEYTEPKPNFNGNFRRRDDTFI